jgi:hypothetical protein
VILSVKDYKLSDDQIVVHPPCGLGGLGTVCGPKTSDSRI